MLLNELDLIKIKRLPEKTTSEILKERSQKNRKTRLRENVRTENARKRLGERGLLR